MLEKKKKKHDTFQRQTEIILVLFTLLDELYVVCVFFGHEPRKWSLSLPREPIKTIRNDHDSLGLLFN